MLKEHLNDRDIYLLSTYSCTPEADQARRRLLYFYGTSNFNVYLQRIKIEREARKHTLHYKMYKAGQAWRILFKLIIRSLFKIKL